MIKQEITKNKYSAADINLFNESFEGFISSVDVDPKYGHFITFRTDSKSLKFQKNSKVFHKLIFHNSRQLDLMTEDGGGGGEFVEDSKI